MSHCAPEATLKPKRFEFTLKTVITDVFVAQVYWEAVPKTWHGDSKASVAKCVVRPWNSTRSVGGVIGVNIKKDLKRLSFFERVAPTTRTITTSSDM